MLSTLNACVGVVVVDGVIVDGVIVDGVIVDGVIVVVGMAYIPSHEAIAGDGMNLRFGCFLLVGGACV